MRTSGLIATVARLSLVLGHPLPITVTMAGSAAVLKDGSRQMIAALAC
jgi:hypothetical protein